MQKYSMPLGRTIGFTHESPDRTASKSGAGVFSDTIFQVWPSRAAMARSIRMQQSRASHPSDWRPLVKLTDGEGY